MIEEVKPLVSISCVTYNHAPFLRQCLDGFFMQQCDFDFEILVHDDASTDGTEAIIKEYQEKYPDIIKPIFQTENQYSKGVRGMNQKYNFPRAKGKYIALCEGDDYWTDPLKLKKQVDFLEKNTDFVMVFSNAEVIIENDGEKTNNISGIKSFKESQIFTASELLENWTVPTGTVVFKNISIDERYYELNRNEKFIFGDIILFLHLTTKGKVYGIKDYTAIYRRHSGGVTNFPPSLELLKRFNDHYFAIISVFGKKFRKPLARHIGNVNFSQSLRAC